MPSVVTDHTTSSRSPAQNSAFPQNRLLAALSRDEYQHIAAALTLQTFKPKQRLYTYGDRLNDVYFPVRALCSVTVTMEDGKAIEVAMIGDEGFVGVARAFGAIGAATSVQIPGDGAYALPIEIFEREMERRGEFHDVVSEYSRAFVRMLLQSAACCGLHSAKERCCRQLLMIHDRVQRDQFALTHDSLASALGVRRPTVTLVMDDLTSAGIIEPRRGQVIVRDRARLEAAACECYRRLQMLFNPRAA
jgi:putative colanic acid biosynthesis UDP-glucose lipid carrier transferase